MLLEKEAEKKPFFYGWVIAIASAVIYGVTSSGGLVFGIFIKPMSHEFGWTRADVLLSIAIMMSVSVLLFMITGWICDRYGPKLLAVAGGLALSTGFFLCSRITELWHLYVGFSICSGIGMACAFVPLTATISKWFIERRGMALGIMYAGGGLFGLLLSPLLQSIINTRGWRTAWVCFAVVAAVAAIPLAFLLKKEPADMGLVALGQGELGAHRKLEGSGTCVASRSYTVKEALRSHQLWMLNMAFFLTMAGIIGAQQNLVPYATDKGIAAGVAAMALGLAAGFNAFGRIAMGFISDGIGTRRSVFVTICGAAAVLFYLIIVDRAWMLIIFAMIFGFVYGSTMVLNARIIAELFGTEHMGAIMGATAIFAAIGPAFGPFMMAAIYDRTGSYSMAFTAAAIAMIVSLVLLMRLTLPGKGIHAQT